MSMHKTLCAALHLATAISLTAGIATVCVAQDQPAANASPAQTSGKQTKAQRGEYLVHQVAMCIYCHTPKDSEGNLKLEELLQGAPMPVGSPYPNQTWGFRAPNLRAMPAQWGEAQFVEFLQTGRTPNGYAPRLPMPPFRMNREDAEAIAAYLSSLKESR